MRRRSYILALALMGVLALLCSPVSAQPYPQQQYPQQPYSQQHSGAQVDVGIFYDSLAPQGDWVEMPNYGWTWAPRVDHSWRPYTRGQWVMTDNGWYWDSDEQFGWATYHYGRWVNDPYYGWVWVPGTEWAPAWVSWRHGNGYSGWAPLPPRATWQANVGLNVGGINIDALIGSNDYAFVQDRSFMDRGIYQQVLPPTQNGDIIYRTTNVTNYSVANRRIVNGGIPVATVEQAVGRRVPRMRTVDVDRADAPRRASAVEVAVYRPEVRAAPGRRPTQGVSLVKGEQPPPALVERRKAHEQERQQKGNQPEFTAKDAQQQRPASQPRANDAQQVQKQNELKQSNQNQVNQQRAKQQNDAKALADKRANDAQQVQKQNELKQSNQQQVNQQHAKQQSDAKAQADKRANDAQQVQKQKPSDQKQGNQQQVDQQRGKQEGDAQAQTGKGAKDVQPAKNTPKDKGKKGPKASPTPPPSGQQQ